jgi:hypothetical protein
VSRIKLDNRFDEFDGRLTEMENSCTNRLSSQNFIRQIMQHVQTPSKKKLGEILVENGICTREQIENALQNQI